VQAPDNSQNLNRYSYVLNNPLSFTDPSGFFFGKLLRKVLATAIAVTAGILTAGASSPAMGFLYAVLGGAAAGGVASGSLNGVLWGAVSGAVFFGIGQGFQELANAADGGFLSTGLNKLEFAAQGLSHGVAGGLIAEIQGGKFGHGFASSGIAKLMTPFIAAKIDDVYAQGAAVAIVGGTTSEITGGKFGNGAVTAAMAFAFNQVATRSRNLFRKTDTLDDAIDKGINSSRAIRRMANDMTREDHPHFQFSGIRGRNVGGFIVRSGDDFLVPIGFDFADGKSGFNFILGSGLPVIEFMAGLDVQKNVEALIINVSDRTSNTLGFGESVSVNFPDTPVFIVDGVSNNVLRFQFDSVGGTINYLQFSGDAKC